MALVPNWVVCVCIKHTKVMGLWVIRRIGILGFFGKVRFKMLYINIDFMPVAITWHVGDKLTANFKVLNVIEVQADGDELQFILDNAKQLPFCHARVQNWFGDQAKWIVQNIIMRARKN